MSKMENRDWLTLGLVIAIVLLAAALAIIAYCLCSNRAVVHTRPFATTDGLDTLQSCPHYWSDQADSVRIAPLAGARVDVPEYNDCQKLITDGSRYGPLGVVFASLHLAGDEPAVAAATILSLGEDYAPLGMTMGGANCLYLWRRQGKWVGRMVPTPAPDRGEECRKPYDVASNWGTELKVHVTPKAGIEVPRVARFERDNARGTQFVSVRCGTEWCAAGPMGSGPPPTLTIADPELDPWLTTLPGLPVTGGQLAELVRSHGWYDDQLLAPPGGGPAASELWAALIPHPGLDGWNKGPHLNRWQVSAFVWIPTTQSTAAMTTLAAYTAKWNFRGGWNAISLCAGGGCGAAARAICPVPVNDDTWFTEVRSEAGGEPAYYCIERQPFAFGHVIGAARWRYVHNDETVWTRCVNGCCEMQ